jgi:hypothetical protein
MRRSHRYGTEVLYAGRPADQQGKTLKFIQLLFILKWNRITLTWQKFLFGDLWNCQLQLQVNAILRVKL